MLETDAFSHVKTRIEPHNILYAQQAFFEIDTAQSMHGTHATHAPTLCALRLAPRLWLLAPNGTALLGYILIYMSCAGSLPPLVP
mgnify:CR=1 FL=1